MYVLGIDFGTTNSSVAIYPPISRNADPNRPELLGPWDRQSPYECLLPTCVLFEGHRPPRVVQRSTDPTSVGARIVKDFKGNLDDRHMRSVAYRTDQELDLVAPPNAVDGSQAFRQVVSYLQPTVFSREDMVASAAAVFAELLKRDEIKRIWRQVDAIVVGVPAAYGLVARYRLLEALHRTGLFASRREVVAKVQFVAEPVAIALGAPPSYVPTEFDPFADTFDPFSESTSVGRSPTSVRALVFDFGGGTLDLALVRATTDELGRLVPQEVLAVGAPDDDLGGRHFDAAIHSLLVARFGEPLGMSRLLQFAHAEQLKIELSSLEAAPINWNGPRKVRREAIETAVAPLVDRAVGAAIRFLADHGRGASTIDWVLPAGGMSLMPLVRQKLANAFGADKVAVWHPQRKDGDELSQRILAATSIGAALHGHALCSHGQSSVDLFSLTEAFVWSFDQDVFPSLRLSPVELHVDETGRKKIGRCEVCIRDNRDGAGPGVVAVLVRQGANDLPLQWAVTELGLCRPDERAEVEVRLHAGRPWPVVTARRLPDGQVLQLPDITELTEDQLDLLLRRESMAIANSFARGDRLPANGAPRLLNWDAVQVGADRIRSLSGKFATGTVCDADGLWDSAAALVLWPRRIRDFRLRTSGPNYMSGWFTASPDEIAIDTDHPR